VELFGGKSKSHPSRGRKEGFCNDFGWCDSRKWCDSLGRLWHRVRVPQVRPKDFALKLRKKLEERVGKKIAPNGKKPNAEPQVGVGRLRMDVGRAGNINGLFLGGFTKPRNSWDRPAGSGERDGLWQWQKTALFS